MDNPICIGRICARVMAMQMGSYVLLKLLSKFLQTAIHCSFES